MKLLFVPLAVLAFILFLIVLGAIGLGIAFMLIAVVGKLWRVLTRADRRRERREARALDI
jgi:predicted membrane metal-binding protein